MPLSAPWTHRFEPQAPVSSPAPHSDPLRLFPPGDVPPVANGDDRPRLTQREVTQMVTRISRPTQAYAAKAQDAWKGPWKKDHFMDENKYSWSKMNLHKDYKEHLWNGNGTTRRSMKK